MAETLHPWNKGRQDVEKGRPMADTDDIDYIDGYTSLRQWTETWEEYLERRKPIIAARNERNANG